MRTDFLHFNGAVERDPAIDAWIKAHAGASCADHGQAFPNRIMEVLPTIFRNCLNLRGAITALSPGVRWHEVVRAIVDHKLAIVLAAVLDGERPDGGVVGQPVPEEFRCIVQPCVALFLNHLGSICDGLLHKLHYVGLALESVARRIVALAEVGPDL